MFETITDLQELTPKPNSDVRGLSMTQLYEREEQFQEYQDLEEQRKADSSIIEEGIGHLRFDTTIWGAAEATFDKFMAGADPNFNLEESLAKQEPPLDPPEQWETDILNSAVSEAHLNVLQEKIQARKDWRINKEYLGLASTFATDLVFEVLNPINYIPVVGWAGKLGAATKVTTTAGRAAITGGLLGGVTALDVAGSREIYTDKTIGEVIGAGIFAATLGGVAGAFIKPSAINADRAALSGHLNELGDRVAKSTDEFIIEPAPAPRTATAHAAHMEEIKAAGEPGSAGAMGINYNEILTGRYDPQFRAELDPVAIAAAEADALGTIPQMTKKVRPNVLVGMGEAIQRSDNPIARYIGSKILEHAEGTGGKVQSEFTADLLSDVYFQQLSGKYAEAYKKNYSLFKKSLADTGVTPDQFGDLVYKDINAMTLNKGTVDIKTKGLTPLEQAVRNQAYEVMETTKKYTKLAKAKGVTEAQNFDPTTFHLTRQYDSKAFVRLANVHGKDEVEAMIQRAVLESDHFKNYHAKVAAKQLAKEADDAAKAVAKEAKLSAKEAKINARRAKQGKKPRKARKVKGKKAPVVDEAKNPINDEETALFIAKAVFNRMSNRSVQTGADANILNTANQKLLIQALNDTDIPPAQLVHIKEILKTAGKDRLADPTKGQISMNMSVEHKGMKMTDLLNTDLANGYLGELRYWTGRSALAEKGFTDVDMFNKALDNLAEVGKSRSWADASKLTQTAKEVERLSKSWDLVTGRPIEADINTAGHKAMRGLRKLSAVSKLGKLGFAQASETGRILAELGIKNSLEGIPFIKKMFRNGVTGKMDDAILRDLEDAGMGRIGDEYMLRHPDFRVDDLYENVFPGEKVIDKLNYGLSNVSLFNIVNKMQKRLFARQFAMKLRRQVTEGKLPEAIRNDMGWSASDVTRMKKMMETHSEAIEGIRSNSYNLNVRMWEPELREKFIAALHKQSNRAILKPMVGDLPLWAQTSMGQFFAQFRTFSLVSGGKHGVHDVKMLQSGDTSGAKAFMFTAAFATLMYGTKTIIDSFGLTGSKRKKYVKNRLSEKAVAKGALNWMGQFGIGMEPTQFMLDQFAPGLFGDDVYSNRSADFSSALSSVPGLGIASDVATGTLGLAKAGASALGGADYDLKKTDLRAILSTVPFNNVIGVANLKNMAIEKYGN